MGLAIRVSLVSAPVAPPPPPAPNPAFYFNAPALPAGVTLTRASAGTRRDAAGAIVSETANVARFDYSLAGQLRGLLIEPARTNQFLQAQNLSVTWAKTGVTATATQLLETEPSSLHSITQPLTVESGKTYTWSAILSEIPGTPKRYLIVRWAASAITIDTRVIIDVATGAITGLGTPARIAATFTALGEGKALVTLTATATANFTGSTIITYLSDTAASALTARAGDPTAGMNIEYQQFEEGVSASTLIPTTTASATRAAEAVTLNWTSLSVPNGNVALRYHFDDGTTQDVVTTIAGGTSTVPVPLNRSRVLKIEKLP